MQKHIKLTLRSWAFMIGTIMEKPQSTTSTAYDAFEPVPSAKSNVKPWNYETEWARWQTHWRGSRSPRADLARAGSKACWGAWASRCTSLPRRSRANSRILKMTKRVLYNLHKIKIFRIPQSNFYLSEISHMSAAILNCIRRCDGYQSARKKNMWRRCSCENSTELKAGHGDRTCET